MSANGKTTTKPRQRLSSGPFAGRMFVVAVSFSVISILLFVQLDRLGDNVDHAKLLAQELKQDYITRNKVLLGHFDSPQLDDTIATAVVQR